MGRIVRLGAARIITLCEGVSQDLRWSTFLDLPSRELYRVLRDKPDITGTRLQQGCEIRVLVSPCSMEIRSIAINLSLDEKRMARPGEIL